MVRGEEVRRPEGTGPCLATRREYSRPNIQQTPRKYDGQGEEDSLFWWITGEANHLASQYPDLVHLITNTMQGDSTLKSFIVDAEAVAVDPLTGDLRSFQELAGRARKDVQISDIKVAVCLYLFDIMLLNGTVNLFLRPF